MSSLRFVFLVLPRTECSGVYRAVTKRGAGDLVEQPHGSEGGDDQRKGEREIAIPAGS
jgi:hypothetical protein